MNVKMTSFSKVHQGYKANGKLSVTGSVVQETVGGLLSSPVTPTGFILTLPEVSLH